MKSSRLIAMCIAIMGTALLTFRPAMASERITGGDFTVDEDVDDDLYISGQNVIVDATIDGDLIFIGKSLTLNGTVTGDLIFGGQWLQINGTVEDDLRAGGMNLIVGDEGSVGDDVNAGAYAFEMKSGSTVGGDVFVGGSQALVTEVAGSVFMGGGSLRIDGAVGGDVSAAVGNEEEGFSMNPATFMNDPNIPVVSQLPMGLSFGSDAAVGGDLSYSENSAATVPQGVVEGQIRHSMSSAAVDPNAEAEAEAETGPAISPFAKFIGYVLGSFIVLLVVGMLLQRLAPNLITGTLDTLRVRTAASFGTGLVAYILFYLIIPVIVVLIIALVILPLAAADLRLIGGLTLFGVSTIAIFTFFTNWVAPIAFALLMGGWLTRLLSKEAVPNPTASLALGLAVIVVFLAIPFFGRFLLASLMGIMGIGAMLLYLWPRRPVMVDPAKTPPPVGTIAMDRPKV